MDSKKDRKEFDDEKPADDKVEKDPKKYPNARERMFSPIDKRILEECERNSLIFACIPLVTLYSVGYRAYVMRNGRKPTLLGYLAVGTFGFFMGRLAYFPFCQRKIAESPSTSPFAQLTREMMGMEKSDQVKPKKKKKKFSDEEFKDETKEENSKKRDVEITYDQFREQNRSKQKPEE